MTTITCALRSTTHEVYQTEFRLEGGQLTWSCTCGAAQEHPCEHLLASAFATWPGEAPDLE